MVRSNFHNCFKYKVLYWRNSVFSPEQNSLIKLGVKIEKWEQALLKRVEKYPSAVMVTIKNNQYTIKNACRKCEPMEFVLFITKTDEYTGIQTNNFDQHRYKIKISSGFF